MLFRNTIFYLLVGIILFSACQSLMTNKTTVQSKALYTEDLSMYRPQKVPETIVSVDSVEVIIEPDSTTAPVNDKLDYLLDTVALYTKTTVKYIDGFTIQVYGGDNRELAKEFQLDILRNFSEYEPKMVFEQPNYKVRLGQYYTRLEAQHDFAKIKEVFPKAILIPKQIALKD